MKKNKVYILGIGIDKLNKEGALRKTSKILCEENNQIIFTPNPYIVLNTLRDDSLKSIFNSADLLIADGIGIIHASRILKDPLPCRITGIELGEFILEYANGNGSSIYILGGTEESLKKALCALKEKYIDLNIVGSHNGFFNIESSDNDTIVNEIRELAPDIIFVCMGSPKQEKWIYYNHNKIPSLRLSIGLGGCLDVWSGKIKRAPKLFQKLSLEWLWRALIEPQRLKKIILIPIYYFYVAIQKSKNSKNVH